MEVLNIGRCLGGGSVSGKGPTVYVVGAKKRAIGEALDPSKKPVDGKRLTQE